MTLTGLPKGTVVKIKETNDTYDIYEASLDTATGTTTSSVIAKAYDSSDVMQNSSLLDLPRNYYAKTVIKDDNDPQNVVYNDATYEIDGAVSYDSTTSKRSGSYNRTVIGFTNTMKQISPTGIVTRYAPYALILVGGIVLLIISKKHKKHTEEED